MPAFVIAVIVFLIVVNALYVAAEFAVVSVRASQIRGMADEGSRLATGLLGIMSETSRLDRYIAACQFGITISSLILGAYGQVSLTAYLYPFLEHMGMGTAAALSVSALVVLVFLTVFQVIAGELVPKSVALQFPVQAALYTYLPLKWSLAVFSPFISLLNGSGLLILKMLRIPHGSHHHIHSREEIDMLLEESRDGGLLPPDEHDRLQKALDLEDLTVGRIMIPRIHLGMLPMDAPPGDLEHLMEKSPYTHIPVYEGERDNVVGMLHIKEVAAQYAARGELPPLKKLIAQVPFVPEYQKMDKFLPLMREKRAQQAFVVDEYGRFVGMVTMERILSEMLGEFGDEFHAGRQSVEILPDGAVRLSGLIRRHAVESWIPGIEDMEDDANTLGGCILLALSRLPKAGETIDFAGKRILIERVNNNMIDSVVILPGTGSLQDGKEVR